MNFRLKEGVTFHLFITTAPCGDSRIFSLHESSSSTNLEAKNKPEVEKPETEEKSEEKSEDNTKNDVTQSIPPTTADATAEPTPSGDGFDPNNNDEKTVTAPSVPSVEDIDPLENFGSDTVAIYVTKAEDTDKKIKGPRPPSDSSK